MMKEDHGPTRLLHALTYYLLTLLLEYRYRNIYLFKVCYNYYNIDTVTMQCMSISGKS